jgi:phosphoadenosine phosphosulfate reductase
MRPADTRRHEPPSEAALKAWSDRLERQTPEQVLAEAVERYRGRIVLACSFGAEDMVLLDMLQKVDRTTPLLYLDTDFLFPETYALRDRVMDHYQLRPEQVRRMTSALIPEEQARQYGEALWLREPDRCCQLRKVEPLAEALQGYAAWITGIRRDQAPTRAHAGLVEWDHKFQLVKFNPLANWIQEDVWQYIRQHDVLYNPLHDRGYPSIGCTHCTTPVHPGEDPRAGRWKQFQKTECGLHK